jgi:hypothetical protein
MVLVGLLLASTFASTPSSATSSGIVIPENVRGIWVTDDPRYAGRTLEITSNLVFIETGVVGEARGGRAVAVETWWEGLVEFVSIEYRSPEGNDVIELRIPEPGTMNLRNLPLLIWRLTPPEDWVGPMGLS